MKVRLLAPLSLALLNCAKAPTHAPGPGASDPLPIQIEAATVLRVGSSTTLSVSPSPHGVARSYAWRSTGGRISGEGAVVLFTAPENVDSVRVNVEVKENDGTTWAGATTIIVFKQWAILVDACDDLRSWFFGAPYSDRLVLPYTVAIEQPIFQPNESGFMTAYDPAPACVTYQIHPKDWDPARFGAFTRIIDFLIAQDVTFTTPSDYEQITHKMVGGR